MSPTSLFEPFTQRGITLANRLVMSPMCMYLAVDGVPSLGHWAHRAVGGVGLIILESTGMSPEGRITPGDSGLWNDAQESAYHDLVQGPLALGSKVGLQRSHAGRKVSTDVPWRGGGYLAVDEGGCPFQPHRRFPTALVHRLLKRSIRRKSRGLLRISLNPPRGRPRPDWPTST